MIGPGEEVGGFLGRGVAFCDMADSGDVKSPGKAAARAEGRTCRADRDRPWLRRAC
jgi:hypothetical protein